MTSTKCLIAALIGTFVYALLSVTAGRDGIWGYKQLQEQKREISAQTASIQKINDELTLEHKALEKDKEVISAYARKLDYVNSDEKLVKITGLKPYQSALYDTGTVLKRKQSQYLPESICKASGIMVFLLCFILMSLGSYASKDKVAERKQSRAVMKGIPVYDVPQI